MHNILYVFEFWPAWTTELAPLDHPKIPPLDYNGENGRLQIFLVIYLRTIQNILMTCRCSGERLLPFGLLVIIIIITIYLLLGITGNRLISGLNIRR